MAGEQLRGLECRVCGQVYGSQPADLYTCGPCRQALASAYAEMHASAETRSHELLGRIANALEAIARAVGRRGVRFYVPGEDDAAREDGDG